MSRPSISTRTGDKGTTGLYGGQRVSKANIRLHACGDVDELNSVIGVALAENNVPDLVRIILEELQYILFSVGADLATPYESNQQVTRLSNQPTIDLEVAGKTLEEHLDPLTHFIMPSGSRLGSLLHQARTVCRRAERFVVELSQQEQVNQEVAIYLNRLSDYLFLAARYTNKKLGIPERKWVSHK